MWMNATHAVVKGVVEEVFANVLVHNMVSEICQVLISRDGLQQLWVDVGSGIRDHVALMVRDEHNLACQLNCELAYVDQFLRLGIPCLLSRDNGNLLVSNQIWTRQGTHVHAYLIYYFPWEYLRVTGAFSGKVEVQVPHYGKGARWASRTPLEGVTLRYDQVLGVEYTLLPRFKNGLLVAIHWKITEKGKTNVYVVA